MHDDIKECFENIGCYLMPNPGKKAATDPNFKGKLAGKILQMVLSKVSTYLNLGCGVSRMIEE